MARLICRLSQGSGSVLCTFQQSFYCIDLQANWFLKFWILMYSAFLISLAKKGMLVQSKSFFCLEKKLNTAQVCNTQSYKLPDSSSATLMDLS